MTAIIITITVLELKVPHGADWAALGKLWPVFLSYVLHFIYIAIYWNNHHHLMHAVRQVNGAVLWANTHLLFWLSLIPFATGWMGENHFATLSVAIYGVTLLMPAIAYYALQLVIIHAQGPNSALARALGRDMKGKASLVLYVAAIGLAFVHAWIARSIYLLVVMLWFIPDRRIERGISAD